jgi:hypothetical protein
VVEPRSPGIAPLHHVWTRETKRSSFSTRDEHDGDLSESEGFSAAL